MQQRVEILKALVRDARVLILDEPTAVLTPGETEDLFRIMRELRESGRAIVFISHKLKEVQAIADTITILRRGRVVGERPPDTSEEELAALMVGRSVQLQVTKTIAKPGPGRARRPRPGRAPAATRACPVPSTPPPSRGCPSGCGPARFSAWPACRATARRSCARR